MKHFYLNNAGAGIMSQATYSTIIDHLSLEMEVGAYEAAKLKSTEVSLFYSYAAKLINAKQPDEIAFVDSASRGWNLVMYGMDINEKDTIVTLSSEYGTNLLTIFDLKKKKHCSVKVVPCEKDGSFDFMEVEKELSNGGTILAISHVTAQGSIVNPVVELGSLAKKYNVRYIVDGCQAVGQTPVDVQKIGCNAYIAAGRKWLRGPRGTGILYIKEGSSIRTPQIDLASSDLVFDKNNHVCGVEIRTDAKQFELWERSIAGLLGLSNALKECLDMGISTISDLVSAKASCIKDAILSNSKFSLIGKPETNIGIIGFYTTRPMYEKELKEAFIKNGISLSYICDWDCPLFFPQNGSEYIFRISPHFYTDEMIINCVCDLITNF